MVKLIQSHELTSVFGDNAAELNTSVLDGTAIGPGIVTLFDGATDADAPVNTIAAPAALALPGLGAGAMDAGMFGGTADHQAGTNVAASNTNSANLSVPTNGTITSLPSATDPNGAGASATSNASLATDNALTPSLSVNAANPADVIFTVSGLESDYSGTVTFTDSAGKSDVVPIGSNGTYSANLSNLTNGTLTYLMTVSDPAGNVINVDPTATLGDGSANAPAGTPQLASLLNGYAVQPSWEVAGVGYAVGYAPGTVLKDPATINMPGVTVVESPTIGNYLEVSGNNVVLNGYNFSLEGGWQVDVTGNNATIENSYWLIQSHQQAPIYFEPSAIGGNILNNVIDGNNGTVPSIATPAAPIEILGGGGTFNVEYNYIHDVWSDGINVGGTSATITPIIEYNLLVNMGMATSGDYHPDFLQTQTSSIGSGTVFNNFVFDYNTLVQSATPRQGGTQGITLFDHTGTNPTFVNPDVSYNTLIADPMTYTSTTEGVNPWISMEQTEVSGTGTVSNNYVDPSGNKGVNGVNGLFLVTDNGAGSLNGTVATSNNVNMLTGVQLTANTQGSGSGSGTATMPKVASVASSGTGITAGAGDLTIGNVVTLTINMSEAVTVNTTGGTPTLSLNDGGTAKYTGGTGTNALIFSYTVAAGQNTADLAVTAINLNSATVTDSAGNAANLTGAVINPAGTLQIDTTTPTVTSVVPSGTGITAGAGDVTTGEAVTLTVKMSEAVIVNTTGGTPTLTLNDGGTATYTGGTGTNALTFSYTVAASQNTADLAVTAVNLNNATVKDGAGNVANFSGALTNPAGTLQIGTSTKTTIQTDGSTSLTEVGSNYFLYNGNSGPELKLNGADVTAGQFGAWAPIGAVQTASGYDVAWEDVGANEYTVWATDNSGNYIANLMPFVSGNNTALESLEPTFNQDLNGDGIIGYSSTLIQTDGSTSLIEIGNNYGLYNGNSGLALKLNGADVTTGQFSQYGAWAPIGAVQTASGYDVAWEDVGANEYTVWATDSSGNYVSNIIGMVSGNNTALESLEPTFNQDLNGDGVIGIYAAPGTTLQMNTPLAGTSGSTTIGAGAALELAGADSGSVTFASSKGTLILDHSSTFSGNIFGFTGNGTLSGSDQIDLKDINFSSAAKSYSGGVLTVTDGINTAKLNFQGSYVTANFKFASDGTGGTIVYDPPIQQFDAATGAGIGSSNDTNPPLVDAATQNYAGGSGGLTSDFPLLAFGAQATLGYMSDGNTESAVFATNGAPGATNVALLSSHMAACFATASDNNGGVAVAAEASQGGNQSLLTNPQHK